MTIDRIREIWKNLGKIVHLTELADAYASGVKAHMVAVHQQFSAGAGAGEMYDDITAYLVPFQQKVTPVAAALDRVDVIGRATVESYLRVIAPELDLAANAPTATVLITLAAQMVGASGTIAPSGAFWGYFRDQFSYTGFPQADPPALPDAYITTVIV